MFSRVSGIPHLSEVHLKGIPFGPCARESNCGIFHMFIGATCQFDTFALAFITRLTIVLRFSDQNIYYVARGAMEIYLGTF